MQDKTPDETQDKTPNDKATAGQATQALTAAADEIDLPTSRGLLLWEVIVFQFKLAVDGLRDVILLPVSLLAALLGFLTGGDPARFYRRVLLFGRRTEAWINLFGHERQNVTADDMIKPIQERVFAHAEQNPALKKATVSINRSLDSVSEVITRPERRTDTPPENPDNTRDEK